MSWSVAWTRRRSSTPGIVSRNSDLIMSLQKLGPMVVNIGNHGNVDLEGGEREKTGCKLQRARDLVCLCFSVTTEPGIQQSLDEILSNE